MLLMLWMQTITTLSFNVELTCMHPETCEQLRSQAGWFDSTATREALLQRYLHNIYQHKINTSTADRDNLAPTTSLPR